MTLYSPINSFVEKVRLLFKRRVQDTQLAYLGNGAGVVEIHDRDGYVYARFPGGKDASGNAQFSPPFPVRSAGAAFQVFEGCPVKVKYGSNDELEIDSAVYQALDQAGIDTRTLNPLHQQSKWVYIWQITIGICTAVANTVNDSLLVSVKKHLTYYNNTFSYFETGTEAEKIDLAPYMPAADMHRYALVWKDAYGNIGEVTTSTTQSLFMPLDINDINEAVAQRPPDAVPYKAFVLANNGGTLTQNVQEVDTRQFMNVPQTWGFPNPVAYRERIHPDRQVLYAGSLVVTGSLEVLGSLVGIDTGDEGGGSGGGAPDDATYLLQVADGGLPNAQAMGALATGLVKNTTTTGVQSIAVAGTDYVIPATIEALTWKNAVRLATTAALAANTYNNGSSGVGATLTANANGALSIDGTAVVAGNRVLIKNEGTSANNGIYIVTATGSAGAAYVLTRAVDFDTGAEVPGTVVFVFSGVTNLRASFRCDASAAPTIGTTAITFTRFDGANNALGNLTTTAINEALTPDSDDLRDLGTSAIKWRVAFTDLLTLKERTAPSTPASGDASAYAKVAGTGQLFFVNDSGVHKQATESIAILWDAKAANTAGGTSSNATWNARDLNTEHYDPDTIVSISSNQFTPIAGDYELFAYTPFVGGSAAASAGRARLFNVTGGAAVQQGMSIQAGTNIEVIGLLNCKFTANGTDAYRIDTYTSVGRATNGLGIQVNDGSSEIYTTVVLRKIA
jgi:hypothetical protein